MTTPFEPLHQPPNPADLRRDPPGSSECARVRGLMRDFVDGDLPRALRPVVEAHVHACRVCGVALERKEHEVLRIRRAYATGAGGALRNPARPRPGFAQRTVSRLLADVTAESAARGFDGGADARGPAEPLVLQPEVHPGEPAALAEPAPAVVASATEVRPRDGADHEPGAGPEEAAPAPAPAPAGGRPAGSPAGRRAAHGRYFGWLLASMASAAACVALSWLLWQEHFDFGGHARLSVQMSDDAWIDEGNRRTRLRPGDGVGDGATLVVEGFAKMDWHDPSRTDKQPAAELSVRGDGELRLEKGEPLLLHGTMEVTSYRRMSVMLGDGTRIELGAGAYHIDAVQLDGLDRYMRTAEAALSVRVEVMEGDPAQLSREGGGATVRVGEAGSYRGAAEITVDPLPGSASGPAAGNGRQQVDPVPTERFDLTGTVIDINGELANCDVWISFLRNHQRDSVYRLTDSGGRFGLPENSGFKSTRFVVAAAWPPAAHRDLGVSPPDVYELLRTGDGYSLGRPIYLLASAPLRGQVSDIVTGQPIPGARIVPCLYDELFGMLLPWVQAMQISDPDGRFLLLSLPPALPRHQSLGVVVLHPEYEPLFRPIPRPGSIAAELLMPVAVKVRLHALAAVDLRGLAPLTDLILHEEVLPGLPGVGRRLREGLRTDAQGDVPGLRVGRGRLWLQTNSPAGPRLRELVAAPGSPNPPNPGSPPANPQYRLAPLAEREVEAVFRDIVQIAGTEFGLAHEFRYKDFESEGGSETLVVFERGIPAAGAHVFAVSSGRGGGLAVRFVGVYGPEFLEAHVHPHEQELVALSPHTGSTAYLDLTASTRIGALNLQITGSAHLAARAPQGEYVMALRFEPVGGGPAGPRPAIYRYLTRTEDWTTHQLPVGNYHVHDVLAEEAVPGRPPWGTVNVLPGEREPVR